MIQCDDQAITVYVISQRSNIEIHVVHLLFKQLQPVTFYTAYLNPVITVHGIVCD